MEDATDSEAAVRVGRRVFLGAAGLAAGAVLSGTTADAAPDGPREPDTYLVGPAGVKPAASEQPSGTLYYETDADRIRYADGSAWVEFEHSARGVTYREGSDGSVERTGHAKLGETVTPEDFGAVGDGQTDDSPAIQAALDSLGSTGGTVRLAADSTYLVENSITLPEACALVGDIQLPELRINADTDATGSQLLVDPSASLVMRSSSAIRGCMIQRSGLSLPVDDPATFAGTAIRMVPSHQGIYVGHCMIVGFEQALTTPGDNPITRVRCEYLNIDCTNGIRVENCIDISYIERVHVWPFATQPPSQDRLNRRHGTAFEFRNTADWCKFTNCFAYGYTRGFVFDAVNSCTALGCGSDYTPGSYDPGEYAIGYEVRGSSTDTTFVGCQGAAAQTAFRFNVANNGRAAKMLGCTVWDVDDHCVDVRGGQVAVDSCRFTTYANLTDHGVTIRGGEHHQIRNCSFQNLNRFGVRATSDGVPFQLAGNVFNGIKGTPVENAYVPTVKSTEQSGGVLPITPTYDTYEVTGNVPVHDLSGGWSGRTVHLQFADPVTVVDDLGIELHGDSDFAATTGSTLTLTHRDGTWYERGRSDAQ